MSTNEGKLFDCLTFGKIKCIHKTEMDFLRDHTQTHTIYTISFDSSMCPIIMSIIPLLTLILIQNIFIYDQHLLLHFQHRDREKLVYHEYIYKLHSFERATDSPLSHIQHGFLFVCMHSAAFNEQQKRAFSW